MDKNPFERFRTPTTVKGTHTGANNITEWKQNSKGPFYKSIGVRTLTPADHFRGRDAYNGGVMGPSASESTNAPAEVQRYSKDGGAFIKDISEHFVSLDSYHKGHLSKVTNPDDDESADNSDYNDLDQRGCKDFRGSSTLVNPESDGDRNATAGWGFSVVTDEDANEAGEAETMISPVVPFTRLHAIGSTRKADLKYATNSPQSVARITDAYAYNRFKYPVSDNEFRKGFHSTFITRPECYVCCIDGTLSEQAASDPIFSQAYIRMPHICRLLSPSYVCRDFIGNLRHNWNFLLSNRIISVGSAPETTLETIEPTKGVGGYTVSLGSFKTSGRGGEVTITFRESRNLEVYEFLRLWIEYIHKRYRGYLSPSYNGYQKQNGFTMPGSGYNDSMLLYQVYDRSLDYCVSLFDMFTDEAMSKILFWTKWYGLFPKSATLEGMNIENGQVTAPNEGLKVTATFVYDAKETCNIQNLVEFNYNSDINTATGAAKQEVISSPAYVNNDKFFGSVGMFTGPPFVVFEKSNGHIKPQGIVSGGEIAYAPHLKFAPVSNTEYGDRINKMMNMNMIGSYYQSNDPDTGIPVQYNG